jgi:hypothetical protein
MDGFSLEFYPFFPTSGQIPDFYKPSEKWQVAASSFSRDNVQIRKIC